MKTRGFFWQQTPVLLAQFDSLQLVLFPKRQFREIHTGEDTVHTVDANVQVDRTKLEVTLFRNPRSHWLAVMTLASGRVHPPPYKRV